MNEHIKTVYAVTHGDYSDYHVVCICEDDETAQRVAATINGDESERDDAEITQMKFCLHGLVIEQIETWRGEVVLYDDGTVGGTRPWTCRKWNFELGAIAYLRPKVEYVRTPMLNGRGGYLRVYASSEQAMEKVIAERLAAFTSGSWRPHRDAAKGAGNE